MGVFAWVLSGATGAIIEASLVDVIVGGSLDQTLSQRYPGQLANFGNQFPFAPNLNLMLPPSNHSHLCNYPKVELPTQQKHFPEDDNHNETSNITAEHEHGEPYLISRENMSVVLFVRYGECLPAEKATVAVDLWRELPQYGTVTHLLIYNDDYRNMDELNILTDYMEVQGLEDISIILVSTRTGRDIMETIQEETTRQRIASPDFSAEGNELWYLPISFLESQHADGGSSFDEHDPYSDYFGDQDYQHQPQIQDTTIHESDDFYWFRLIVFSLLVVSPCFRAAYLWYAGGARIRFRYNEQGRIVGLQYIPPMPYWFSPRPDESYAHPASRMTREQVLALPEIVFDNTVFQEEPLIDNNSASSQNEATAVADDHSTDPKDSAVQSNENADIAACVTDSTGTVEISGSSSDRDNLTPNDASAPATDEEQAGPCEMHTTCSICIDDFEQGERLRMLPRCRHIFHTGKRLNEFNE